VIALMLTIEVLTFQPASGRAMEALRALQQAVPRANVRVTGTYRGQSDLLVFWGPGAPDRADVMRRHVAKGGHAIALDLPYWDRFKKFRISIDAAHPQAWVMRRQEPDTRLKADRVPVADRWNPDGPVIVAGIGRKARVQYGAAVEQWEGQMIAEAQRRGKVVQYRRKQPDAPVPQGVPLAPDRPIDAALSGASLVVTWHSNVAVDAIRNGIPVMCRDGAAAAVCPSVYVEDPQPLAPETRNRFLSNLAWYQWHPREARQCWKWLREVLA
jgi:hypothetical protein